MFKTLALKEIVCIRDEFSMEIKMNRGEPYICSCGVITINNDEIRYLGTFLKSMFDRTFFPPRIRKEYKTIRFFWDNDDAIPLTITVKGRLKRTAPDDCLFFRKREVLELYRFLNAEVV